MLICPVAEDGAEGAAAGEVDVLEPEAEVLVVVPYSGAPYCAATKGMRHTERTVVKSIAGSCESNGVDREEVCGHHEGDVDGYFILVRPTNCGEAQ